MRRLSSSSLPAVVSKRHSFPSFTRGMANGVSLRPRCAMTAPSDSVSKRVPCAATATKCLRSAASSTSSPDSTSGSPSGPKMASSFGRSFARAAATSACMAAAGVLKCVWPPDSSADAVVMANTTSPDTTAHVTILRMAFLSRSVPAPAAATTATAATAATCATAEPAAPATTPTAPAAATCATPEAAVTTAEATATAASAKILRSRARRRPAAGGAAHARFPCPRTAPHVTEGILPSAAGARLRRSRHLLRLGARPASWSPSALAAVRESLTAARPITRTATGPIARTAARTIAGAAARARSAAPGSFESAVRLAIRSVPGGHLIATAVPLRRRLVTIADAPAMRAVVLPLVEASLVEVGLVEVGLVDVDVLVDVHVAVGVAAAVVAAAAVVVHVHVVAAPVDRRADQHARGDSRAEPDESRRRDTCRRGPEARIVRLRRRSVGGTVHRRRLVLRDVDHLRIRRLDGDHLRTARTARTARRLADDGLLRRRLEVAGVVRLGAQALCCVHQLVALRQERVAQVLRPFQIVRHAVQDVGEDREGFHAWVPVELRQRLVQVRTLERQVLLTPPVRLDDLERIRGGDQHLGEDVVRIERDRRDHLLELRLGELGVGAGGGSRHAQHKTERQGRDRPRHVRFRTTFAIFRRVGYARDGPGLTTAAARGPFGAPCSAPSVALETTASSGSGR